MNAQNVVNETPTTEEVRKRYIDAYYSYSPARSEQTELEFERWLADLEIAVRASERERCAVTAEQLAERYRGSRSEAGDLRWYVAREVARVIRIMGAGDSS